MYLICYFKGDKNEVFAGCGDNNIYVWDLESGAQKVRCRKIKTISIIFNQN